MLLPNEIPAVSTGTTGFQSPAIDYMAERIDLTRLLVWNRPATFLVRADGNGMQRAGIWDGDVLVVDRSIRPRPGCVVVAAVDGGLVVRRLVRQGPHYSLVSEHNGEIPTGPIALSDGLDVAVWGVVTTCLRRFYPL